MSLGERRALGKAGMLPEEALAMQQAKSERELQKQIGNLLRLRGIEFNVSRMDRRKTDRPAWPDFTFAFCGVPIAIEAKTPGANPTADQLAIHARMRANGWRVFIVRGLTEVISLLADVHRERHWEA
jgi:hypothetical protein